jgi:hypothetical protein
MELLRRKTSERHCRFKTGASRKTISGIYLSSAVLFIAIVAVAADIDDDVETFTFLTQSTQPMVITPQPPGEQVTELAGGVIANRQQRLNKIHSPYLLREDLIVEKTGELVIEPGVLVRFAPMVGLTIRGILSAKVSTGFQIREFIHETYDLGLIGGQRRCWLSAF